MSGVSPESKSARASASFDPPASRPRSGRATWSWLPLVLAASGCAYFVGQVPIDGEVERREPAPVELLAGAGRARFTPVGGDVPLAGFGPFPDRARDVLVEADGTRHELEARALSLRAPGGFGGRKERVVLVAADLLVVPRRLRALALAAWAGGRAAPANALDTTEVIVCATHTHQGIGGFWRGTVPEAASIGPYDDALVARLASGIALAIERAVESERPAMVTNATLGVADLVESRARPAGAVDPTLSALGLDDAATGRPIARLVVLAAHPTELAGTRALSPAWPGSCARALEREGGVALVLQGGLGDARPHFPAGLVPAGASPDPPRVRRSRLYGEEVARRAAASLAAAPARPRVPVRSARASLALPMPTLGAIPIPILDRVAAAAIALDDWPGTTACVALRLDDALFAFAPFELVAATTLRARARLESAGFRHVAVVSLANDWLGYAPDGVPWPWNTSGAASFGGTGMGSVTGDRLAELGERLAPARR